VTLWLGAHPANSFLSGTPTVSAVNGIATFDNLSINLIGVYNLIATDSEGLGPVTSPWFIVV
jgi:hypothetical protein